MKKEEFILGLQHLILKKKLEVGDNITTFTPRDAGTFVYSCWMGMIRGSIIVQ